MTLKLRVAIWVLLLAMASLASAQTVTVTGNVLDPNGVPYSGGSGVVKLVSGNGSGSQSWTFGGTNPVNPVVPIAGLDSFGFFSVSLMNTSLIDQQSAQPEWQFQFCSDPNVLPQACFTVPALAITSNQSITAQISAVPPPLLPNSGGNINLASPPPIGYTTPNRINATVFNKVVEENTQAGGTLDVRLTNAMTGCPTSGTVVDARSEQGAQTIASPVTITCSGQLDWGPNTTSGNSGTGANSFLLKMAGNDLSIVGLGGTSILENLAGSSSSIVPNAAISTGGTFAASTITLASNTVLGSDQVQVVSASGIAPGQYYRLFNSATGDAQVVSVQSVSGTTVTLYELLQVVFPSATTSFLSLSPAFHQVIDGMKFDGDSNLNPGNNGIISNVNVNSSYRNLFFNNQGGSPEWANGAGLVVENVNVFHNGYEALTSECLSPSQLEGSIVSNIVCNHPNVDGWGMVFLNYFNSAASNLVSSGGNTDPSVNISISRTSPSATATATCSPSCQGTSPFGGSFTYTIAGCSDTTFNLTNALNTATAFTYISPTQFSYTSTGTSTSTCPSATYQYQGAVRNYKFKNVHNSLFSNLVGENFPSVGFKIESGTADSVWSGCSLTGFGEGGITTDGSGIHNNFFLGCNALYGQGSNAVAIPFAADTGNTFIGGAFGRQRGTGTTALQINASNTGFLGANVIDDLGLGTFGEITNAGTVNDRILGSVFKGWASGDVDHRASQSLISDNMFFDNLVLAASSGNVIVGNLFSAGSGISYLGGTGGSNVFVGNLENGQTDQSLSFPNPGIISSHLGHFEFSGTSGKAMFPLTVSSYNFASNGAPMAGVGFSGSGSGTKLWLCTNGDNTSGLHCHWAVSETGQLLASNAEDIGSSAAPVGNIYASSCTGCGPNPIIYDSEVVCGASCASINTSVATQNMVTPPAGGAVYRYEAVISQVDIGTGCSAPSTVTLAVNYTDFYSNFNFNTTLSGRTGSSIAPTSTATLGTTISAANIWTATLYPIIASTAASLTFNTTYSSTGSGCSTPPKYTVRFLAFLEKNN